MLQGDPALRADPQRLRELVVKVGEFQIRDRAMTSAQRAMQAILAERVPTAEEIGRYRTAVERYFSASAQEAQQRLRDVDRRIAHVNQVQFNLQAERGVALRRVEVTQGVLSEARELAKGSL
ncbi:MAG: hypothetical protein ACRENA_02475 [Vulcanimicrobiaceae bacterium]